MILPLAGLPRSGTTVLRSILEQNLSLSVSPYSGLSEILTGLGTLWVSRPHSAFPRTDARLRVLKAIAASYHDSEISVDLARDWPSKIDVLEQSTGRKANIVCMVRPPVEIFASLERLHRLDPSSRWSAIPHADTVAGRVENNFSLVRSAYDSIASALDSQYGDRLLFVDYHKLVQYPDTQMRRIYGHWGVPEVNHQYDNLILTRKEDDLAHGRINLHSIESKLSSREYQAVDFLGKRLVDIISTELPVFWNQWT